MTSLLFYLVFTLCLPCFTSSYLFLQVFYHVLPLFAAFLRCFLPVFPPKNVSPGPSSASGGHSPPGGRGPGAPGGLWARGAQPGPVAWRVGTGGFGMGLRGLVLLRMIFFIFSLTKVPFGDYFLFFLGFWKANPSWWGWNGLRGEKWWRWWIFLCFFFGGGYGV